MKDLLQVNQGNGTGDVHKIIRGSGVSLDGRQNWSGAALKPLLYRIINIFSMNDTEYPNLFTHGFEDYAIIPDS